MFYDVCLGTLQNAMEDFTKKVVNIMKSEGLFESKGGLLILARVYFDPSLYNVLNVFLVVNFLTR